MGINNDIERNNVSDLKNVEKLVSKSYCPEHQIIHLNQQLNVLYIKHLPFLQACSNLSLNSSIESDILC